MIQMIHHNLGGILFQVVCFHACSFFKELTISVNAAAWKESNQSEKDPQHGKQCSPLKMAEISSLSPWVMNVSAGTDYFCRVKFSERPFCLKQHNQYPTEVNGKGKTTKCSTTGTFSHEHFGDQSSGIENYDMHEAWDDFRKTQLF